MLGQSFTFARFRSGRQVVGGAAEKVGGEVCSEVVGACGGGALEFKTAVSFYFVDQASRLRLIWLQSGGKSW